jgi:hypothetical protein
MQIIENNSMIKSNEIQTSEEPIRSLSKTGSFRNIPVLE